MRVSQISPWARRTSVIIAAACALAPWSPALHAQEKAAETAAVPAPKPPAAPAAKKAAPPSPKSLADWRGKVIAHLNSRKSASAAGDGVSTVAFSIDRGGKVLSAKVLTSSGNKALDDEAVALTQRASPVPAPPADIAGSTLFLKVPIRFKRLRTDLAGRVKRRFPPNKGLYCIWWGLSAWPRSHADNTVD